MPRLVAQSEQILGRVYQLEGKKITLGNGEKAIIQIEDDSMSELHAELIIDQLDYVVKDLGSTNGTRVNGERVTEQKLRRNDVVSLGNIKLRYESEHEPDVKPLPKPTEAPRFEGNVSKGRPAGYANVYTASAKSPKARAVTSDKEDDEIEEEVLEEVVLEEPTLAVAVEPEQPSNLPWPAILSGAAGLAAVALLFFLYRIFS
jgi:pSer/pThr/pTyr-binding forkhead associated (FHA) protein